MMQPGNLYGVGTGPGDPELLTLKAVRILSSCDVVAHFAKRGNSSNARRTVEPHLRADVTELPLLYPVTTQQPKDSRAYKDAITAFFDASAAAVRAHLLAGRSVAVLSEGDPLFYGSYMHLHIRLAVDFPAQIIPGITAMSGCWSMAGLPIIQGDDCLTVLPGTLSEDALTTKLRQNNAAVIMKVGRNLGKIRAALQQTGLYERAIYVERGTQDNGFHLPLRDKQGDTAPYFSLVLVPGWSSEPRSQAALRDMLAKPPNTSLSMTADAPGRVTDLAGPVSAAQRSDKS